VLVKLEVVTAVPWMAKVLAVTVPLIAGSEPIVTDEMLIGTVPEMLAVTEPIWAVPATNAGSVVRETACVAGKLEMLAVTLPIWLVPAPIVTVPAIV